MDRSEFTRLRDLPGKSIDGDIVLQRTRETAPLLCATVRINNASGADAKLRIEWNEQTNAKTLNVWVAGTGPICRLEVDSKPHKPHGRSHKHSLQQPDCPHPSINLSRHIENRDDLQGHTIHEVFTDFCQKAHILHKGKIFVA